MKLYFKTIFTTAVPFIVTMFFAYLIGSFLNVSWNPVDWTMDMRILMSIFGMGFGIMLWLKLTFERLV